MVVSYPLSLVHWDSSAFTERAYSWCKLPSSSIPKRCDNTESQFSAQPLFCKIFVAINALLTLLYKYVYISAVVDNVAIEACCSHVLDVIYSESIQLDTGILP